MHTKRLLIIVDIALSAFAVLFAYPDLNTGGFRLQNILTGLDYRVFPFILLVVLSSFLMELYSHERFVDFKVHSSRILLAMILAFLMLPSFYFFMPCLSFDRILLFKSIAIFSIMQLVWHKAYHDIAGAPGLAQRVLVLGSGPLAEKIGGVLTSTKTNYSLLGFVAMPNKPASVVQEKILGDSDALVEIAKSSNAQKLVVSLGERRGFFPLQEVLSCKFLGLEVVDATSFYEEITGKLLIENMTPSALIFSRGFRITETKKYYKRILDVSCSTLGLLLTLPVVPIIALLIKLDSKGPIFFKQIRVGEGEKTFVVFKFRTMRQDAEKNTGAVWAQKNDTRVTKLGSFLRKTRLDEIPQLFNILRGDMSFIGPRPERPEFVEELKRDIPFYSERHFVKPGLTGWAQIRYPYGASVEDALEKLRFDLFYIKNMSVLFDLYIILETVKVILFRRGSR
ncbi:MAG: TIGR03013 family PEP-CTERM/XrtA system glycosyltransferase [Nitrospirae bacterium]|nr:TIGR03013 family PEP-CTERM/XrtA system glycosyltransferase [Nitrospirota bacterium]